MCSSPKHQRSHIAPAQADMLEAVARTLCRFALLRGRCWLLLIVAVMLLVNRPSAHAQTKSDTLAQLNAKLLDKDPALADQPGRAGELLREDLRRRLRAANERSRGTWQAVETVEQWENYRDASLTLLKQSLGEFPAPPPPLDIRVTGRIEGDGFVIENTIFQSRPGLWLTANVYVPQGEGTGRPGLIIGHSHHTSKEHGELQDMGMTWARRGCVVLVMDYLGHGERRQHPFATQEAYAGSFQPGRQDYYFRYDVGVQLALLGDSLLGWMAWDLSRGIDYLLQRPDVDAKRIILMGAVAGGGEPIATAAAIDPRVAAAIPFNFGGPQPETQYPLPDDAELSFNYAGSGSWESTRNQRLSAAGVGFQPWVVVGALAPRPLGYAHEFAWDGPRDPVWKRLQQLYSLYNQPNNLAVVHGHGLLSGRPPEASHCTHIGAVHRQMIHPILKQWFGIHVSSEDEYQNRLDASRLRAMTPEIASELQPRQLVELLPQLADERSASVREKYASATPMERRAALRQAWDRILLPGKALAITEVPTEHAGREEATGAAAKGPFEQPGTPLETVLERDERSVPGVRIERVVLQVGEQVPIPTLFLKPNGTSEKVPVVIGVSSAGKEGFLTHRPGEIADLLERGIAVCLPDVRGTGETHPGRDRGSSSAATSHAATELMLGGTTIGAQLSDLLSVLAWLRQRVDVHESRLAVWGDGFSPVNPPDAKLGIPRRADQWPRQSEPGGALIALLAGLYDDNLSAVYAAGALGEFRSVLTSPIVLMPFDAVVPGMLATGDLRDLASALAPTPLCLAELVDPFHQDLARDVARERIAAPIQAAYRQAEAAESFAFSDSNSNSNSDSISESPSAASWLAQWLVP